MKAGHDAVYCKHTGWRCTILPVRQVPLRCFVRHTTPCCAVTCCYWLTTLTNNNSKPQIPPSEVNGTHPYEDNPSQAPPGDSGPHPESCCFTWRSWSVDLRTLENPRGFRCGNKIICHGRTDTAGFILNVPACHNSLKAPEGINTMHLQALRLLILCLLQFPRFGADHPGWLCDLFIYWVFCAFMSYFMSMCFLSCKLKTGVLPSACKR